MEKHLFSAKVIILAQCAFKPTGLPVKEEMEKKKKFTIHTLRGRSGFKLISKSPPLLVLPSILGKWAIEFS